MTKILDDIYYYRHPINANAVIFAFKTGRSGEIDVIDTGIQKLNIWRNAERQMLKDGLDPRNVRNIFHTHYHFDHAQADVLWQKRAKMNKGNVKVFVAEPDSHRTKDSFTLFQSNLDHLNQYFNNIPEYILKNEFNRVIWLARMMLDRLLKIPTPENLYFYKNEEELLIGEHKVKAITTGGHTEGHSFFYFPEMKILHTGDNNALNETVVNFGDVAKSMVIAQKLRPDMIFIGHNAPKTKIDDAHKWVDSWFIEYDKVLALFKPLIKNNSSINITKILTKMAGWLYNIQWVKFFTFMQIFVILKHMASNGYGTMDITSNGNLFFNTAENVEDMELNLFPKEI